jgi:hypothetical protein
MAVKQRGGAKQRRDPACAGLFYPKGAEDTRLELDRCFASVQSAPEKAAREMPFALIAPHAGYGYSGGVAAHAYARARTHASTNGEQILAVLLGPSHRVYFEGLAGARYTHWRTPLGDVPVANELYAGLPCTLHDAAHAGEHSLEVQLPFLQSVLAPGFRILPLLVGRVTAAQADAAAKALKGLTELAGTRTLFICSTDLSHDHAYAEAKKMDGRVAELVTALDAEQFDEEMRSRRIEACGMHALLLTLHLARLAGCRNAEILALTNSGEIIGDIHSRIVGYFAALITG